MTDIMGFPWKTVVVFKLLLISIITVITFQSLKCWACNLKTHVYCKLAIRVPKLASRLLKYRGTEPTYSVIILLLVVKGKKTPKFSVFLKVS